VNSGIWNWVDAGAFGLVAMLVVCAALVTGGLARRFSGAPLRGSMDDPRARAALIAYFNREDRDTYFDRLHSLLGFASQTYGETSLSWRAYGTCLTLAFFYPLVSILLGWLLFNIWSPAGIDLFRDIDSDFGRLWRFALFAFSVGLAFFVVNNSERLGRFIVGLWIGRGAGSRVDQQDRAGFEALVGSSASIATIAIALWMAIALPSAFAGSIAVAVAVAVAGAFAGGVAVDGAFALAVVGGFGVAGICAAAFAVAVIGDLDMATLHLLLYALLPLLNAGADMISLWITRSLLGGVVADRPTAWRIFVRVCLDLCLAALCIIGLIGALIFVLTQWAWLSPATLPLDWRAYWAGTQADPQTGVALYMMVLTTLIPTIVHLTAGLGAVWTQRSPSARGIAATLATQPIDRALFGEEIRACLRAFERVSFWGHTRAALVVGAVATPLIWGVFVLVT
jgi:hypothetical protein